METEYNESIDIWSIGMMTYEALLGKIPFRIYSELDLNRIVTLLLFRSKIKLSFHSMWILLSSQEILFCKS